VSVQARTSPLPADQSSARAFRLSRTVVLVSLALLFAFAALLRWNVAAIPLERDEGGYAYIAQRWLLGETPYVESFDQKPPATYVVYAAIQKLIGTSAAALHWGAQLFTFGTLALVFVLGARLHSPLVGLLAGGATAYLTIHPVFQGNAVNTELLMLLPLVGAVVSALAGLERRSARLVFLSGFLCGAAVLFKQVAAPHVAWFFAYVAWAAGRDRKFPAWMIAGGIAAVAPVFAYFALVDAWGPFYDAVIGHNVSYAEYVPWSLYLPYFKVSAAPIAAALWPVLALVAIGLLRLPALRPRRHAVLLGGWLVASAAGTAIGGYFRGHYFIQMIPPVALLAAIGADALSAPLRAPRIRAAVALLAVAAAILWGVWRDRWYFRPGLPDVKSRVLYGTNPFPESVPVARFIRERSRPDERTFIYGSEPQILYYARRKSASRYIYIYPLTTTLEDSARRQPGALAEVKKNKPKFVVTVFVPTSTSMRRQTPMYFSYGLKDFLFENYRVVGVVPFLKDRPPTLVTGDDARVLWERDPVWDFEPSWCSIAIWERSPRLVHDESRQESFRGSS
jgi:hypothetical protein